MARRDGPLLYRLRQDQVEGSVQLRLVVDWNAVFVVGTDAGRRSAQPGKGTVRPPDPANTFPGA